MTIRVFIADDHRIVRDGLRSLLEDGEGIIVVGECGNGCQAVEQIADLQPDVVLMDISMPHMNGIEATRQILELSPKSRVIILSMLGDSAHVFEALQAGAQGYLLKESAGREVAEAIQVVWSGQYYFSQQVASILVNDYVRLREHSTQINPLDVLSGRERQILDMVIDGKSSVEISIALNLSPKTVESYRSRMMRKLGVDDMPGLLRFALHAGLIS